jgi:hypothetical protein
MILRTHMALGPWFEAIDYERSYAQQEAVNIANEGRIASTLNA